MWFESLMMTLITKAFEFNNRKPFQQNRAHQLLIHLVKSINEHQVNKSKHVQDLQNIIQNCSPFLDMLSSSRDNRSVKWHQKWLIDRENFGENARVCDVTRFACQ